MRFSVLTLNLWNISEPLAPGIAALAAGLKTLRPDIVCLQEIEFDPRTRLRQSAIAADACGLVHAVDSEQLSILSRFPVERSGNVALPDVPEDQPRQALSTTTRIRRLSSRCSIAPSDFAIAIPKPDPAIRGSPGCAKILTCTLRPLGASVSITSSPPVIWRQKIAPSSLATVTALISHRTITPCSALSYFAPSQR
jgi:hypothetical protein